MNPSRPTMSHAEAKQFTKDFSQLNARLIGKLTIAKTMEEAKEALSMLENLANFDLPQAKTLYGMMFLMNGKPWYDITKALYWQKKGAEEADELKEHFAANISDSRNKRIHLSVLRWSLYINSAKAVIMEYAYIRLPVRDSRKKS